MDIGRRRQPRQERRVFDGVPSPKAAPSKNLVTPPRSEHNPERERTPGENRPATLLEGPTFVHPSGNEHRDGEGEGHAKAHESEVQQRWMNRDEGIVLQQRVGARSLKYVCRIMQERIGRTHHQEREEGSNREEHHRGPADDGFGLVAAVVDQDAERDRGLQENPQHERAFERRPKTCNRIQERRKRRVILRDVGERKIVGDERKLHHADGGCDASDRETGPPQCTRGATSANDQRLFHEPSECAEETDVQGSSSKPRQDHRTVPLGAFTRLGCAAMYDAVCLTNICVAINVSDVSLVKWPSTTTGMSA